MSKIFKPHDYQERMIDWMCEHERCGVWAPMGGGKSATTLETLERLSLVSDVYPALVLAPLRVANSTWPGEVQKWSSFEHLRVSAISGRRDPTKSATAKERLAALNTPADIYTLPYDGLAWLQEALDGRWPFRTVVADEWTRLKGFRLQQGTARAQALKRMMTFAKGERFIGLTGTPAPNGIKDLWGQVYFIDKGYRLGKSFSAFSMRWFTTGFDGYSLQPREFAQAEVEDLLRDICLTVDGLPVDKPIVNIVPVELPPKARALYNDMQREAFVALEREGVDRAGRALTNANPLEIEAVNAAVKINKCVQIANGLLLHEDGKNYEVIHTAKLDALDSIVEEANGMPVLTSYVFVASKLMALKAFKQARELDADPGTLDRWNRGEIPLLLAHPACLHPETEVLTEFRGWVKIITVAAEERVFDGEEFVAHGGCVFSGTREVIEVFGLTLTPSHRLLVADEWLEAKDVRDTEGFREAARYTYAGYDPRLRALLAVPGGTGNPVTERAPGQPGGEDALRHVSHGGRASVNGHPHLADMEGDAGSGHRPLGRGLCPVRRCWTGCLPIVAGFQNFLRRHVSRVFRLPDDREGGQLAGVFQSELPVGYKHGAAGKQEEQQACPVQGAGPASGGILPSGGGKPGGDNPPVERRDVGGRRSEGLRGVKVQAGSKVSPVYDLVDCGPRSRFLVRNAAGEVFVSHNSAGHGLNMQDGGNILADLGVTWNLEHDDQIIERIGPLRQKQSGYDRPVFRHRIVAKDTFEDRLILPRLETKRSVQDLLLEAMRETKR